MQLQDYLRILRKQWGLIVIVAMVGLLAGAGYSLLQNPRYEATSRVYVAASSTETVSEALQGSNFIQSQLATYAEAASEPIVIENAIALLGIDETPGELGSTVTGSRPTNTLYIDLTANRATAEEAAAVANAVTASFVTEIPRMSQVSPGDDATVRVSIVREATVPGSPVSPNIPLLLALGGLVGLALGVAVAVLREVLDTRIRNERDLEAVTDAAVIGGIAYDPATTEHPLIVHDSPRSPRAESFRTLRTNLQFLDLDAGARSFVVTSSVPGEGKSTTSANLAIALADSGARVVVIEGDLRRPKLSQYMGIEGAVGITDVLVGQAELGDVLQRWGRRELYVLPAGTIPPNPSELLGSQAMAKLLRKLEDEYDVVLIDAPPLLPVTDGALVSKLTRGALLVVGAKRVHRGEVEGAIQSLEAVGARLAGVVMTMMPTKGPDSYGGRYGYAGYGYDTELPTPIEIAGRGPGPASGAGSGTASR